MRMIELPVEVDRTEAKKCHAGKSDPGGNGKLQRREMTQAAQDKAADDGCDGVHIHVIVNRQKVQVLILIK